ILDHHGVLRTSVHWENLDRPLQIVHHRVQGPIHQEDWRELAADDQQQRMARVLREDLEKGFDLTTAPLLRLILVRVADDVHELVWSYPHLLMDGWCVSIVLRDVLTCYRDFRQHRSTVLPDTRPFEDYIRWLHQQDLKSAEAFWRRALEGVEHSTPL